MDAVGEADSPDIALACLRSLRRGGILVLDGSMKCPLPIPYGALSVLSECVREKRHPQSIASMHHAIDPQPAMPHRSLTVWHGSGCWAC